jgi:glycine/D-amino acid oxidase-like deaminating enzyme
MPVHSSFLEREVDSNSHGQVDYMTRRVDPNHKAGCFLFLGSGFYFVEAGRGQVDGGGFEEAVKVAKIIEVLDGHEANCSFMLELSPPVAAAKPVPGMRCAHPTRGCQSPTRMIVLGPNRGGRCEG